MGIDMYANLQIRDVCKTRSSIPMWSDPRASFWNINLIMTKITRTSGPRTCPCSRSWTLKVLLTGNCSCNVLKARIKHKKREKKKKKKKRGGKGGEASERHPRLHAEKKLHIQSLTGPLVLRIPDIWGSSLTVSLSMACTPCASHKLWPWPDCPVARCR